MSHETATTSSPCSTPDRRPGERPGAQADCYPGVAHQEQPTASWTPNSSGRPRRRAEPTLDLPDEVATHGDPASGSRRWTKACEREPGGLRRRSADLALTGLVG